MGNQCFKLGILSVPPVPPPRPSTAASAELNRREDATPAAGGTAVAEKGQKEEGRGGGVAVVDGERGRYEMLWSMSLVSCSWDGDEVVIVLD